MKSVTKVEITLIPFVILFLLFLHSDCSKKNPMDYKIEESKNISVSDTLAVTDTMNTGLGTILESKPIWAEAGSQDSTQFNGLYAKSDLDSLVSCYSNDSTLLIINDGTLENTYYFEKNEIIPTKNHFCSLSDLVKKINRDFLNSFRADLNEQGEIVMSDQTGQPHKLSFYSINPVVNYAFKSANGVVNSALGITVNTNKFSHIACGNDKLTNLQNVNGKNLDLQLGDTINISAKVGSSNVTNVFSIKKFSTLNELNKSIKSTLNINGLRIDQSGRIIILGNPGKENEIRNLSLRETGNKVFNLLMVWKEIQKAID